MASEYKEYNVEDDISTFFSKTSVRRDKCDLLAKELVGGGQVVTVPVQGNCSYTVYAGPDLGHVVQFRLKSLELKTETAALARRIFGTLAPEVSFRQQLGQDSSTAAGGREPLLVYVMTRMPGISRLDFVVAHGFPENSPENMACRKNLIRDVARFFAIAWKAPQTVDQTARYDLAATYEKELQLLLAALPVRFRPIVRTTLAYLPAIFSLPMVLAHQDFYENNIMVEELSYHLVGVIDWAEAEVAPFGTNLDSVNSLMSKLHLRNGIIKFEDYDSLNRLFWETFSHEVGGLDKDTTKAIKAARVLGLLRTRGFTSRLANMPDPVPNKDDESGRYNLMILDGLLLNPTTRYEELDGFVEENLDWTSLLGKDSGAN